MNKSIKMGFLLGFLGPLIGSIILFTFRFSELSEGINRGNFIGVPIIMIFGVIIFFIPGFILGLILSFCSRSKNIYLFGFSNFWICLVLSLATSFIYSFQKYDYSLVAPHNGSYINNSAYMISFLIAFSTLALTKNLYNIKFNK